MDKSVKKLEVDYIVIEGSKKDNLDKNDIKNTKKIVMDIILKEA